MNATIFSGATALPIALPVAPTTTGAFAFSGFSSVIVTKNITGYPGGNAGEKQQITFFNPDSGSDGGNVAAWAGNTLSAHCFIRGDGVNAGDAHEFSAYGSVLAIPVVSTSAANPTVVTTSFAHNLKSGQTIYLFYHTGSTPAINSATPYVVTVTSATTFTIPVNVTVGGTGGQICGNPLGNINFRESSNVDAAGGIGGTAGPMVDLMTTDWGTAAGVPTVNGVGGIIGPAVGHQMRRIDDIGGAWHYFDRAGNEWLTLSADGSTLTFGGNSGTLTTLPMNTSVLMGNNDLIILDVVGATGNQEPKIQFGTGGPGFYSDNFVIGANVWTAGANATATTTAGSPTITVTSASGLSVGQYVQGTGILPRTKISVISGTTITLSKAPTLSSASAALLCSTLTKVWQCGTDLSTTFAGLIKSSTGKLNLAGIPTSSSGLSSGDVYSNAGILTIVP